MKETKFGEIYEIKDIIQNIEKEVEAQGKTLPPAVRLHIGEPSFSPPAHIMQAAIDAIQYEPIRYGPASGWLWLRSLLAEKIKHINNYSVGPEHIVVGVGGTVQL